LSFVYYVGPFQETSGEKGLASESRLPHIHLLDIRPIQTEQTRRTDF